MLMIGGVLVAASLIKLPDGKTIVDTVSKNVGSELGKAPVTLAFSAANAFVDTAYKGGMAGGEATNNFLTPKAQQLVETNGIILSSPQVTEAQWEKEYQQQTNPLYGVPILGRLSEDWHTLLTMW